MMITFPFPKQTCYFSFKGIWGELLIIYSPLPTQNDNIWRPGNETQQSTVFLVRLGTTWTFPTDSTFEINSRWIVLIWCDAQKWPVEMSFTGLLLLL